MISAQCPRCLRKYRIPPEHVGAIVNCRAAGCSQSFQVPPADPEILLPVNSRAASPAVPPLLPVPAESSFEPVFGDSQTVRVSGLPISVEPTNPPTRDGSKTMLAAVCMFVMGSWMALAFEHSEGSFLKYPTVFLYYGSPFVLAWGILSWVGDWGNETKPLFPWLTARWLIYLSAASFLLLVILTIAESPITYMALEDWGYGKFAELVEFIGRRSRPFLVPVMTLWAAFGVWGIVRWIASPRRIDDDLSQVR